MNDYKSLRDTELFLLDMDGTLYLGEELIPGALEFMDTLKSTGREYIYLTNNSSRAGLDYVDRLRGFGLPCEAENVFSSGMATAMTLQKEYPGSGVYVVGTNAFRRELLSYGVRITDENPDIVVVGFDRELTFEKLNTACRYLRRDAVFIAANMDLVCPMPHNEIEPDCGSICALLESATGRKPRYIGKPNPTMVDILSEKTGIPNKKIAVVGDRLYTDIAVGINAGAVSVCVLSGETDREMLEQSDLEPDYVFSSVEEMSRVLI